MMHPRKSAEATMPNRVVDRDLALEVWKEVDEQKRPDKIADDLCQSGRKCSEKTVGRLARVLRGVRNKASRGQMGNIRLKSGWTGLFGEVLGWCEEYVKEHPQSAAVSQTVATSYTQGPGELSAVRGVGTCVRLLKAVWLPNPEDVPGDCFGQGLGVHACDIRGKRFTWIGGGLQWKETRTHTGGRRLVKEGQAVCRLWFTNEEEEVVLRTLGLLDQLSSSPDSVDQYQALQREATDWFEKVSAFQAAADVGAHRSLREISSYLRDGGVIRENDPDYGSALAALKEWPSLASRVEDFERRVVLACETQL